MGEILNDPNDPAVSGSKDRSAHCWKYCPYSTQTIAYNQDLRVPDIEKVYHSETQGFMHSYSLGAGLGWMCADNDCPYVDGVATTEVIQAGRQKVFLPSGTCVSTEADFATLSGTVLHSTVGLTIVSGTRYFEI